MKHLLELPEYLKLDAAFDKGCYEMWDSSQSSDWAFTPPDSPGTKNVEEAKELELNAPCFNCLGQVTRKDHKFHEESYIRSRFRKNFHIIEDDQTLEIKLFHRRYCFWTALETEIDVLFYLCRKNFMLLNNRLEESINELGLIQENITNEVLSPEFRKDIHLFLNYIYTFIKSSLAYYDKSEKLNVIMPKLEEHLESLQLLFHNLSFAYLPDHVLLYYASIHGNKSTNPAYHLIHCQLDVRWLCVKISGEIKRAKKRDDSNTLTQFGQNENESAIDNNIMAVISELIWISILKYEKLEGGNIGNSSGFSCSCVKELWLLLIHHIGFKDFWRYFNQILRVILDNKNPPENFVPNSSTIHIPEYFDCSNRGQYALWMLTQTAKLYEYNDEGLHVGRHDDVEPNFPLFSDIVKIFINSDPSEMALRNYIPLIQSILNLWKHDKNDSVIYLLEYYLKKLNSAFYIPGSKLDGMAVSSHTAEGLLDQVKNRLDLSVDFDRNENSYSLFLRLLGTHINRCQTRSLASKLCGRIFVQFSPSKLDKLLELSELGLYHLASLYLTLALVKDITSVVRKLLDLMIALPRDKLSPAKQALVWKSLTASLILLTERNCDITESAEVILKQVSIVLSERDLANLPIFIDGLKIILESENPQICILIDEWIANYLKCCTANDADRLFIIFEKVVKALKMNSWSSVELANQLRERLMKHVLPFVNIHITPSAADIAALFVLLFAEYQSNKNELIILHNFWSNCSDVKLASRYLCATINDDAKEQLKTVLPNYQIDIVQCWIKCHLLSKNSLETSNLSDIAINLSPINQIFKNFNWRNSSDYLSDLIYLFGTIYNKTESLAEKASIKEMFLSCFNKLDKWVQDEMKKIEGLSKETIDDLYRYCGEIIEKCGDLLHTKSNPQSLLKILMDSLLLPPQIFKVNGLMLPASQISAIFRHLHLYIRGLINLRPDRDPYVQSCLKNIIIQYLPRLFRSNNDHQRNPIYKAIYRDESAAITVAEIIANEFLVVKNNEPHPHSCNAIQLISEVSKSTGGKKIFEVVVGPILNLIMLSKEYHEARGEALNYLRSFINVPGNDQHLMQKIQQMNEKHISFTTKPWFGLLLVLAPICSQSLSSFLPEIEKEIEKVEKRRGVERDSLLRNFLKELQRRLGS